MNTLEQFAKNIPESDKKSVLYHAIGERIIGKTDEEIKKSIDDGKYGKNHECFDDIRNVIEEQDSFIKHPFEVAEGVLTCTKQLQDGSICNNLAECFIIKYKPDQVMNR